MVTSFSQTEENTDDSPSLTSMILWSGGHLASEACTLYPSFTNLLHFYLLIIYLMMQEPE